MDKYTLYDLNSSFDLCSWLNLMGQNIVCCHIEKYRNEPISFMQLVHGTLETNTLLMVPLYELLKEVDHLHHE